MGKNVINVFYTRLIVNMYFAYLVVFLGGTLTRKLRKEGRE